MSNFTTRENFFIFSYSMLSNEREKMDNFLKMLEKSGVEKLICKDVINYKGGRPNNSYCNLLATILYCFAFGKGSLRDIEDKIKFDLRVIYLMDGKSATYKTIGNFINKVILPKRYIIFSLITKAIFDTCKIDMNNAYIDGSKFEADANKYKFVWKPIKYHENLSDKVRTLLKRNNLEEGIKEKGIIDSIDIAKKITEFDKLYTNHMDDIRIKKDYKCLIEFLNKSLEYEEKERICGPNRNSYYKTDHDATAMCLKEDYYSGLGSNMHAAYNTQIMVFSGLISSFIITQSRNDLKDFIPLLEKHKEMYGNLPKSICADAGYGSLDNYEYMDKYNIENYVKYFTWEGNVSGKKPSLYHLNKDGTITCLNGKTGKKTSDIPWHSKKKQTTFYKIEECLDCPFKLYCRRFSKDKDSEYKYFEVSDKLQTYIQQAEKNLLSVKGIEMRVNRSTQVEGAYGVIKQDIQYERFRRTSIKKVETEFMLVVLGYNIRKLFKFYSGNFKKEYWKAPEGLNEETFKKPNAKRLSNSASKKKNKSINEEAKRKYKNKKSCET